MSVRPVDHTHVSTGRTPSWSVPFDLPVATCAGRRGSPARNQVSRPHPVEGKGSVKKHRKSTTAFLRPNRTAAFYPGETGILAFRDVEPPIQRATRILGFSRLSADFYSRLVSEVRRGRALSIQSARASESYESLIACYNMPNREDAAVIRSTASCEKRPTSCATTGPGD